MEKYSPKLATIIPKNPGGMFPRLNALPPFTRSENVLATSSGFSSKVKEDGIKNNKLAGVKVIQVAQT